MNARLGAVLVTAITAVSFTAATAEAQTTGQGSSSSSNQTIYAPSVQPNPPASVPTPTPLFKIGNLPVGVWAPVQPPYDVHANRNNAANPLWYADDSTF